MKKFRRWMLGSLLGYCIAGGVLSCANVQHWLMYHPVPRSAANSEQRGRKAGLQRWTTPAGENIGWRRLSARHPAQGRILVLYGNSSCAIGCAHYAQSIQSVAAFDVFILSQDYLRHYEGPVAMLVDGHDWTIPPRFALRLYKTYAGPKKLWEYPQGGHTAIPEPREKFWREVIDFWQSSRQAAATPVRSACIRAPDVPAVSM